ncbi:MAG: NYN domain-containing protein [Sulfurimicrobium sp.]|nr:NYN domain-containing protein [Sulfurimicrobium sp.]
MTHESNIALLIDADNCPAAKIEEIIDELAKYGVINIRRAYGNWNNPCINSWAAVLHDYAIQPIQQFAYTKGKNATDAAMIIDAMDLLYTQKLDGFCLASSDSDFTPLVMRIRANGLKVLGFGEQKTPSPFVNACSKFLYLEHLGNPEQTPSSVSSETRAAPDSSSVVNVVAPMLVAERKSAKDLKGDTRLMNLLRNGIEAAADDDGWANLSAVGSHISKQASFDSRNLGYSKLSGLIQAIDLFEIKRNEKGSYVRDKKFTKKKGQ